MPSESVSLYLIKIVCCIFVAILTKALSHIHTRAPGPTTTAVATLTMLPVLERANAAIKA